MVVIVAEMAKGFIDEVREGLGCSFCKFCSDGPSQNILSVCSEGAGTLGASSPRYLQSLRSTQDLKSEAIRLSSG